MAAGCAQYTHGHCNDIGHDNGMTMGAMGFGTTTAAAQTTKAPDSSNMSENAVEWNKGVTMGWNLGNYFECDGTGATWYTNWGNPKTTQAMIKAVKAAGFDAIRIPVRWGEKFDNTNQTVDSKELDMVQEVVDWCLAEDMKVVINTHHEKPWLETNVNYANKDANLKKLSAIWTAIATRFCDYDGRLAFAGVNEVLVNWSDAPTAENNEVLNSYHQTFVDAVRATGGRNYYRNLVVQTYACNPSYGLSGLEIPTDVVEGRLTVVFHYYQPWSYCGGENGEHYWLAINDSTYKRSADLGSLKAAFNDIAVTNGMTFTIVAAKGEEQPEVDESQTAKSSIYAVSVAPNPTTDGHVRLRIRLREEATVRVTLSGMDGHQYATQSRSGSDYYAITITLPSQGVWIATVESGESRQSYKLISK